MPSKTFSYFVQRRNIQLNWEDYHIATHVSDRLHAIMVDFCWQLAVGSCVSNAFFHWKLNKIPCKMQPSSSKTVNPKLAFHTLKGSTAQFSIERSVPLTQMAAADMTLMLLVPLKKATFSHLIFLSVICICCSCCLWKKNTEVGDRLMAVSKLYSPKFLNKKLKERWVH